MVIIHKKNIKLLTKKNYPNIKNLCKEYKTIIETVFNVPDTYTILVEKLEHFRYLLSSEK